MSIQQNLTQSKLIYAKIGLFIGCLVALLLLSKLSSITLTAVFVLAVAYFFIWREEQWRMLLLVLPLLTLGNIFSLEIKPGLIYDLTLSEAILGFCFLVFLIDRTVSNTWRKVMVDWVTVSLGVLLLLAISSYNVGIVATPYLYVVKILAFSWLAYFLARNLVTTSERLSNFYWSVAATILIISAEVAYKFFQLGVAHKFFTDRKAVVLPLAPLATTAAILVCLTLLLVSYYLWRHEVTGRSFGWIAIIFIAFFAIFISLGKAALISLFLGLAFLFFKIRERRVILLSVGISAIVLGVIMFSPVAVGLFSRVTNTFNDANTQYRLLEYRTSWEIIADNWQFGVGAGQQIEYFRKMLNLEQTDLLNNFLLQAVVDLGVVGLVSVLLIMASLLGQTINLRRQVPNERWLAYGLFAVLIAAFFNGLVEVTFLALPYAIVFWLSLGSLMNVNSYETNLNRRY